MPLSIALGGLHPADRFSCYHACRTLVCERGVLHRADGSARWAQGGTSVLASVYGPQSTLARKEDPEKAVVEVSFYPCAGSVGAPASTHPQLCGTAK